MAYLYTGTRQSAATQTGLSTQVVVKVDGITVGAIQQVRVNQQRPLNRVGEVGTDGVIEIHPNQPTTYDLSITRLVFDAKRLPEAMSRGFLNIHSQRIPFDLYIYDFSTARPVNGETFDAEEDGRGVITTIYENCWFSSLSTTYQASNYVISEDATCWAEFAHSFRDGDVNINATQIVEGLRNDRVERLADTSRRGSLDARGLTRVNDVFSVVGDNSGFTTLGG